MTLTLMLTLMLQVLVFAIFVCSCTSTNRLGNRRVKKANPCMRCLTHRHSSAPGAPIAV
jgi:hypothetical protein